jgi:hypothetical protein
VTIVDTRSNGITAAPGRIGQGTAVEQSRAVAEVHAAIVVAQQCPRDITRAQRAMRQSCAQKTLAERAFFSYPRAGETVTGPSVQLARELARCFGNVQYGIAELRRDDGYGQSEMLAFAWDVETNTRSSTTFVVPHRRDTKNGVKALTDMRDIYENNANNGARRLREMIFAVLPAWFTEEAVTECYETLADKDGEPMADRIARVIGGYANLKITQAELERKVGAPAKAWSAYDVAHLAVVYRSIVRGEARKEDEFPDAVAAAGDRVGTSGITPASGHTQTSAAAPPAPAAAEPQSPGPADGAAHTEAASPAGPGAPDVPGPTRPGSSSAGPSRPPQQTSPPSTSSPNSSAGALDPPTAAASASAPEAPAAAPAPAQTARSAERPRPVTKRTLGRLKGALFSVPLGNSQDTQDAVCALAGRKVTMPESLHEDEAAAVLAAIDKALEDAGGAREAAAAALLEKVAAVLTTWDQDAAAEGQASDE